MTNPPLSPRDLLQLVQLVESTDTIQDFHLRHGDLEISLSKRGAAVAGERPSPITPTGHAPSVASVVPPAAPTPPAPPQASGTAVPASDPLSSLPPGAQVIKSPTVGTFYAAKEPGAAPFVAVGQQVTPDSTLCIIEVMKLMNTIQAGVTGMVTHILVGDTQAVEFGQPLMVIAPAAA